MWGKNVSSGYTVHHLNGPVLSVNYGFDNASKSGLKRKKKIWSGQKEKNAKSKFCSSGVIATDGK